MAKYLVTARHTPLPVKRLEVEARTPQAACRALVAHNKDVGPTKFTKTWPTLVKDIEAWEAGGCVGLVAVAVGLEPVPEPVAEIDGRLDYPDETEPLVSAPEPEPAPQPVATLPSLHVRANHHKKK